MQRHARLFSAVILLGGLACVAATAFAQAKPAPKDATGYIVSLGDAALVISNRAPSGGPGGGPQGAQTFSRTVTEGGPGPGSGGARQGFQVQLGPGDIVRGADGKLTLSDEAKKRFTPEQQKTIQETLNSQAAQGGGPVVVRRGGPEGAEGDVHVQPGKVPAPSGPLELTDFVLDKKTKSPHGLAKGDKVKVTFVEADGKKVATKIEKAK